jgi:ABC-type oligopeptide transport system substrate-binding subunit
MSTPTARSAPGSPRSWEQNDKATEFTLHLKSGVTFSDGTPLDASAVVANLDIWYAGRKSDGINPIGLFPKTYDHAEAIDAATVKVFFKKPTLGFIPTLGYHGSILISPKTIAQPATEQADLSKTSGSGPMWSSPGRRATSSSWSSARTTIGVRRQSATPARPFSTRSPTSWFPSRRSESPRPVRPG